MIQDAVAVADEAWIPGWTRRWLLPLAALFTLSAWLWLPLRVHEAAFLGLACSVLALRAVLAEHHAGHAAEALRLGFDHGLSSSLWNPLAWVLRPPRMLVRRDPKDDLEPWDRILVAIAGPVAHERRLPEPRRLTLQSDEVYLPALLLAGALAVRVWAGGPSILAGIVMHPLLIATILGPLRRNALQGCVEESSLPSPRRKAPYARWAGWKLVEQRRRYRDPEKMSSAVARALSIAGLQPRGWTIEIGAGAGALWPYVPELLRERWVQADLEYLSMRYAQTHDLGRHWVGADLANLPFPAGTFEAAVGIEAFDSMLLSDLHPVLDECARALKPGGMLVHLSDYPLWPGERLAGDVNRAAAFLSFEPVRRLKGPGTLQYMRLAENERRAVDERAAEALAAKDEATADLLELLRAGPERPDLAVPNQAACFLIRRALVRRGWTIVHEGDGTPDEPDRLLHLVARAPR